MIKHTPPPPANDTAPRVQRDDTQAYCRLLHDLMEVGMERARELSRRSTVQPGADVDLVVAFECGARAVRYAVLLMLRFGQSPAASGEGQPVHQQAAARRRILRAVEEVIRQRVRAAKQIMDAASIEPPDSPEFEEDIGDRAATDVIADVCRDIGLADLSDIPAWKRGTPPEIAKLCALAARPYRIRTGPVAAGLADPGTVITLSTAARTKLAGKPGPRAGA